MAIKVDSVNALQPVEASQPVDKGDGSFTVEDYQKIAKAEQIRNVSDYDDFYIVCREETIQQIDNAKYIIDKVEKYLKIEMAIRDMKKYRELVKDFLNEIVNRSHKFSRENFLDRRGRHRVYGIVKLVDKNLDDLASELVKDEKDHLTILSKVGEIRGLLLDIST